jgi:methanogenic corrinoid protein MtbC1/DNA-binding XRE family transcriptional regulator
MARRIARLNVSQAQANYRQALIEGDADKASAVVAALAEAKMSLATIYTDVLAPAMVSIGDMWCQSKINVAQEHLATQITIGQMEKLRLMQPVPRPLPYAIMVACVEGELHFIGARMAADLFQLEGWSVDFLGPDVPTRALIDIVAARRVNLLCVSITMKDNLPALALLLKSVRTIPDRPKLIIGGQLEGIRGLRQSDGNGLETAATIVDGLKIARKLFKPNRPIVVLDDYLKELGRRIRVLRLRMGWTQEQLATATKLTRAYLVSVEAGRQNVSMDVLVRIANALNVPPDQLIGRDDFIGEQ